MWESGGTMGACRQTLVGAFLHDQPNDGMSVLASVCDHLMLKHLVAKL